MPHPQSLNPTSRTMSSSAQKTQDNKPDYSTWSTDNLISRISELEHQLQSQTNEYNNPTPNSPAAAPRPITPKHAKDNELKPLDVTDKVVDKSDAYEEAIPVEKRPPKAKTRGRNQARPFDPSKYHTRFIALKFAYLGQGYNGLEHANGTITPLPTVEEVLWKALRKTRLITVSDPASEDFVRRAERRSFEPFTISWEGCDYSKAGRTDKGVSAFGQVVALRVRSARPKRAKPDGNEVDEGDEAYDEGWDDIADEFPYVYILNSALPKDIRVLAWCPHPPPSFDARFSCRERQYKYFFTQPAFSPTPGAMGLERRRGGTDYREGWLDIGAMQEAAKHFEGTHDFRNLCSLDTSKQITNFERIIYRSDIEMVDPRTSPLGYVGQPGFQALEDCPVENHAESPETSCPNTPRVYVFNLCGSAFLWHQVRHMIAILFLVGQGLESPSIVPELMDVSKNPCKPSYDMASDAPLVLWDCVYPDLKSGERGDSLDWVYAGDSRMARSGGGRSHGKFGSGAAIEDLWAVWRQRKMDEILAGALLDLAIGQGDQSVLHDGRFKSPDLELSIRGNKYFEGDDAPAKGGPYVPLMKRQRAETVEVRNAKYMAGRGQKKAAKRVVPEVKET